MSSVSPPDTRAPEGRERPSSAWLRPAFVVALTLGPALALAAAPPPPSPPAPAPEDLCTGGVIRQIVFERVNVFDPSVTVERKWAYRAVNTLHSPMLTREGTLRRILTIREGQPCTPAAIEEAERELRNWSFLQDAWVTPVARDGDDVTVVVRSRDAWSTRARASFSSQGGVSQTALGLAENNLFGTGVELEWQYSSDQDRVERELSVTTPPFFAPRLVFDLSNANNSDGDVDIYAIRRPFWTLDTRWAFEARYEDAQRIEKVYVGPDPVDRWRLDGAERAASVGLAPGGLRGDRLRRWLVGAALDEEQWTLDAPADATPNRPDLRPRDRDLALLMLGWEWTRVDFRRVQFVNRATRVEDLDLSNTFRVQVDASVPGLSEDAGGSLEVEWRRGVAFARGSFFVLTLDSEIHRLRNDWYGALTALEARYDRRLAPRRMLHIQFNGGYGQELEGPEQFLLGGDTGLRGYRSRAFTGNRLVLLNLEHRWFSAGEWLRLVRPGFVVFTEVGGAWEGPTSWAVLHPDIGVGLRLALLRSSSGATAHLNVAFPLDPNGDPGNMGARFSFVVLSQL